VQDDPFDAVHVEQVEGQSALAGLVHSVATVLLGQAQEFLGLAQVGPGEGSGQQGAQEAADVFALLASLPDQAVRIAAGVGSQRIRVVLVVCTAMAGELHGMGLNELALGVDTH